jgi:hypothetical protein
MPSKQRLPRKQNFLCNSRMVLDRIYMIRSVKVKLDRDLAELYGVETKVLKQAITQLRQMVLGSLIILCKNYTILSSLEHLFCNILNRLIIRLRRNDLKLVGVKRKSRHRGCRDESQGEPHRSSSERRRVNFAISFHVGIATAQFRFDTTQLASGSFIFIDFFAIFNYRPSEPFKAGRISGTPLDSPILMTTCFRFRACPII